MEGPTLGDSDHNLFNSIATSEQAQSIKHLDLFLTSMKDRTFELLRTQFTGTGNFGGS